MSDVPGEKTLREALRVDLSRQLAAAIGAQPFQCALNAWRALIEFPALFRSGGRLVEGWFVVESDDRVVMNEHVWCELADGSIVDPSVLLLVPATTPVWYFAGLTRSWEEAETLEGEYFPHVRFDGRHGPDGLGHPGYRAAREAARRTVYARALRPQPPKAMQFLTAQDLDDGKPLTASDPRTPLVVNGGPLDLERSLAIAHALPAVPDRCWYNAREAMMQMPHQFLLAAYVEGWILHQGTKAIRITEHGWIEDPPTGIVDPTIVLDEAPGRLEYFPGVRLSWGELQTCAPSFLPLARQQDRGDETLAYQHACHLALRRGEALAWHTGLPLLPEPGAVVTIEGRGTGLLRLEASFWAFPAPSLPSAPLPPQQSQQTAPFVRSQQEQDA